MKRYCTLHISLFLALFLLIFLLGTDSVCSVKKQIVSTSVIEELQAQSFQESSILSGKRGNAITDNFSYCKDQPFVKQETDRGNKLPTVLRFIYKKITVSSYTEETIIPYRIIAQYQLKRFSILKSNDYYLYSLCRILI